MDQLNFMLVNQQHHISLIQNNCMKLVCLSLYILLLFSCNPTKRNSILISSQTNDCKLVDSLNNYKILKIDSAENIYIILAQKKELTYKIVSLQDSLKCIKIGQCYNLVLKSVFPENQLQKDRVSVMRYGSVRIPLGGSKEIVWDLFSVQNLKGLCLY